MTEHVLEVEGLRFALKAHFWSATRQLLHDVSFAVQRGEIFGFLGPNGAGKTTSIKAILGLLRPDEGKVRVLGGSTADPRVRAQLGFLPERSYFPDHLTGRELLLKHGLLAGMKLNDAKQRATELLDRVGIAPAADQLLRSYSKGMLQRAGVGQALMGRPKLVIFDEPMSGLDPLGRRDIREIITELRHNGTTVFFSTHILPDVEALCDRVAMVIHGRTRKVGKMEELLSGSVDRIELRVTPLSEEIQSSLPTGVEFEPRPEGALLHAPNVSLANETIDLLRRHGVTLRAMETHRGTLEDVFVKETLAEAGEEREVGA